MPFPGVTPAAEPAAPGLRVAECELVLTTQTCFSWECGDLVHIHTALSTVQAELRSGIQVCEGGLKLTVAAPPLVRTLLSPANPGTRPGSASLSGSSSLASMTGRLERLLATLAVMHALAGR